MPEPDPARPAIPAYAWRAAVVTVLLLVTSTVAMVLMYQEGDRPSAVVAVIAAMLATGVAGVTTLAVRQDRLTADMYRESELTRKYVATCMAALAKRAEAIGRRAEEAAAYHMAVEGQKAKVHAEYLFDRAMKEIENSNVSTVQLDGLRAEVDALAEQQETLAELVSSYPPVTLDVDSGDVYELGKRVGRDETLRDLGHDPTP